MPVQFQTAIDPSYSPVLYTPDYTFLKYVLDKKTQNYEKGLSVVSSAYSNLQKQLSDPVNMKRRDEYLKNAESELQKVASSDLSLQANVNAANTIFDPIATDKAILFDANATATNTKEKSQMEAWRNSENMEERKKFNPLIYNWLNRDMDIIKNGQGNIENYKGYQGRNAFAYVDAQDIINQAAKDYGYETKQDIDGGMYIYGVKDGVSFKQSYKQFADQVLAANPVYQQQNAILGESTYEGVVEQAKKLGIDPAAFVKDYAENDYKTYRDTRKKYVTEIKDDLERQKKEIFAEGKNLDISTPEGQAKMQQLAQRMANLKENHRQYKELQYDYDKKFGTTDKESEDKKQEYVRNFVENPKSVFADQFRLQDVNRFSNIKAATVSTTIKENTAYFAEYKALNDARQTTATILNNINKETTAAENVDIKRDKLTYEMTGKPIEGEEETVTTANADGTFSSKKVKKAPQLEFAGISATDVYKIVNNLNLLNSKLTLNTQKAIGSLAADPNGGAISIIENLGVKRENVPIVRNFLIKQHEALIKDPTAPYKPNKEEEVALNDFYSSAHALAKLPGNEKALEDIRKIHKEYIKDINFTDVLGICFSNMKLTDKDYERFVQYQDFQEATKNVQLLSNVVNAGRKAVVAAYDDPKKHPEFEEMFYTKKNGDRTLVDQDYIFNRFKEYKQFIKEDPGKFSRDIPADFTNEDLKSLAEGFLTGSIKFKYLRHDSNDNLFTHGPETTFTYKGKDYYCENVFTSRSGNSARLVPYSTDEYFKNIDKINKVPIPPEFNTADAQSGVFASPLYNLNGELKSSVLGSLISPTQFNSYLVKGNDEAGFTAVADPDLEKQVRNVITNPKNVLEKGVIVHTKSGANNGGLAVEVRLRPKEKSDPEADYWGETYFFPIDVAKGTPNVISAFSTINDETEYGRIKNSGKPYDMYNFDKMGINVQVVPNTVGSSSGKLYVKALKQDPATKQFMPGMYETKEIEYNTENMTYDELKQRVFTQVVNPYITAKISMDSQSTQKATSQADSPGFQAADVWNKIQQELNTIK